MKQLLKLLINKAGFRISRNQELPLATLSTHRLSCGLSIELTGTSGVGKSTFSRSLNDRKLTQSWLYYKSIGQQLQTLETRAKISKELRSVYLNLWKKKMNRIHSDSAIQVHRKIALNDFYQRTLRADIGLRNLFLTKGVFNDDSFLHNFRSEINELRGQYSEDTWNQFFDRRAIVYLKANYESVRRRLIKRAREEPHLFNWLTELGEDNYYDFFMLSLQQYQELNVFAQQMGTAVLQLDLDKTDAEERFSLFSDFMKNHISRYSAKGLNGIS